MRNPTAVLLLGLLGTSAAAPAPARDAPDRYSRAVAAGYKALTLCSAIFNGPRRESDVESVELRGIYPELETIVPILVAHVDRPQRMVSVTFDDALPPRIAAWRRNLGCAQLPIGAKPDAAAALPRFDASAPSLDARDWPLGEHRATARAQGNASGLKQRVAESFDAKTYGQGSTTTGVVVVQRGRIVAERYAKGFGPHVAQRTWSVAKSIAGTLIGIASSEGLVDVTQPAPIAAWQRLGDPRAAITIDQLMRMASGLHSDSAGNRTDALYFGGTSVSEQVVSWPLEAAPGSRFRYANNDILLATLGLRQSLGDDDRALAYPFTALLWRIGMTRTTPETDWQGNFVLSSQVWTTARDLARFGLLYAHDGIFDGRRVLPEGWARHVATASGPQPDGDFGYGATFWLLNHSAGVPADTFAAFGNRGQYVIIVPRRDIVIVRRGEDPTGARFDIAGFTAQVLAELR